MRSMIPASTPPLKIERSLSKQSDSPEISSITRKSSRVTEPQNYQQLNLDELISSYAENQDLEPKQKMNYKATSDIATSLPEPGEIVENVSPIETAFRQSKVREARVPNISGHIITHISQKSHSVKNTEGNTSSNEYTRGSSSASFLAFPVPFRGRTDRKDTAHPHEDRKPYPSEPQFEPREVVGEPHKRPDLYSNGRKDEEDFCRSEVRDEWNHNDAGKQNCDTTPPSLIQLLKHDEDLKDWLEITGYYKMDYRSKILNRRRAIAALEARRDELLAEVETEERIPAVALISPSMVAPPNSDKMEGAESWPIIETPKGGFRNEHIAPYKRHYSDFQGSHDEGDKGKMARIERRISRSNNSDHFDQRPRSSGSDPVRRPGPISRSNDHYDRCSSRPLYEDEARGHRRFSSRERDFSSGLRAYEGRTPERLERLDQRGSIYFRHRDSPEREERELPNLVRRPLVIRGSYKGRAYDPNFRSRGRGRKSR
jgi:hypothetical protein